MSPQQQKDWQDGVLRDVLLAVVAHELLRAALIFKGARILNLHLQSDRQSLDLDANATEAFARSMPARDQQAHWLERELERALRNYFEAQELVRLTLESVKVSKKPPRIPHPQGWDGLVVAIRLRDQRHPGVLGLPRLELEIAAPELLGPAAVTWLPLGGHQVQAYALHRIAGEKLRAFLSSLPAYRCKMGGGERVPRVKDLHDLARILAAKPIADVEFWRAAAEEFRLACHSRCVDCAGLATFQEDWNATRVAYAKDATLGSVPWTQAEQALVEVSGLFEAFDIFPIAAAGV